MTSGDSSKYDEWAECRTTIGRLDTILQDLRKYGFSLIAGLLTASSFIGYASDHPAAGVAAYIGVMCLIAALFSVDIYYSVLQSAAVERAINLERATIPDGSDSESAKSATLITMTMSWRATRAKSKFVILGVYTFLIVIAGALGFVLALVSGETAGPLIAATLVVGLPLLAVMIFYWNYVALVTRMHRWNKRGLPTAFFNRLNERHWWNGLSDQLRGSAAKSSQEQAASTDATNE